VTIPRGAVKSQDGGSGIGVPKKALVVMPDPHEQKGIEGKGCFQHSIIMENWGNNRTAEGLR
jgi:hypothetical protein